MKEKIAGALAVVFVGVPAALVLFVVLLPYYGWALSTLWNWYFVPYLGLPALNWAQAAGCTLVLSLLHLKHHRKESKSWEDHLGLLLWPAFAVALGWWLQKFV